MTKQEFNEFHFTGETKVEYKGVLCKVTDVDFEEYYISYKLDEFTYHWLRFDELELVNGKLRVKE